MTRFDAPWDRTLTAVTAATVFVCLAATGLCLGLATRPDGPLLLRILLLVLPGIVCLLTPLLAFAFSPRGYEVGPGVIRVLRPAGAVEFRLSGAARRLPAADLRRSLRTFGVGGMFGWYGRFRAPAVGDFRLFATRGDGHVLAPTADGPVVFTPDRPDEALAALNSGALSAT